MASMNIGMRHDATLSDGKAMQNLQRGRGMVKAGARITGGLAAHQCIIAMARQRLPENMRK